ncbi:MAG TPA: VCBS repeat-containing protein [Thermoanaerobaculia bacterium]
MRRIRIQLWAIPVLALVIGAVWACSSGGRPVAPPPAAAPPGTPTPGILSRTDPTVIEETDTQVIRRLPKKQYVKVDDRHIRSPIATPLIEFFKEDEEYYYVSSPKAIPGEAELKRLTPTPKPGAPSAADQAARPLSTLVTAADFTDIFPPRVSGRIHLQKLAPTGLPQKGLWRASFVLADMNGDGILDIVAPSDRLGDGKLHVWLGDGKGAFAPWKLSYSENGKPSEHFSIDYGGVAVGDIDGDGSLDVVTASHGFGLVSLFGDGKGHFDVVRAGLGAKDMSSQAVALLAAGGAGKLDLVASRDSSETKEGDPVDKTQVRLYRFVGRDKGWEVKRDALIGGFYSNTLHAWDYDRDGKVDVLTGSHLTGALTLLWRNAGDGTFQPVRFDNAIEPYAYHFATAPGTFGADRAATFADGYSMQANVPDPMRASGITLYVFKNGEWTRHRIWRKKELRAYLFGLAMGDLDGDGLDDVVFPDNEAGKLRILFQQPDGSFVEVADAEEPGLDSPGQCVRLADLDKDGRLDIVLSKTVASSDPRQPGGWDVYLNRK